MKCIIDENCPNQYICHMGNCIHEPITTFNFQLLASCLLVPILTAFSNRIGASTVWLIYPILTTILAYQLAQVQSFDYISPIVMAAGFIMLYLALRERSDCVPGPAINFYIVNITVPVLIVGSNLGLIFAKTIPELYTTIVGIIISFVFIFFGFIEMKDMQADQKISIGLFKKMLPSRLHKLSNRKSNTLNIQLAQIQQADSQYDHHQNINQISPTRKSKIRQQLLSTVQTKFPYNQLVICLLCFLVYQCLCLSLPQIIKWLGIKQPLPKIAITYTILIILMIIGQIYLYKFYIQPIKISQEINKLNLGLRLDLYKMIKICVIGFVGGYLQGFIGFGLYFALFLYLLHSQSNLKDTIATCGFINIFIGAVFSLNYIFCTQFHWLSYIIIFFSTLLIGGLIQYGLDCYINKNIIASSLNSTLIIISIIIMFMCLLFMCTSLGLNWSRFGFATISSLGDMPKC